MILFVCGNLTENTFWADNGKILYGEYAVTWVERYREPGEFNITGELSSDVLNQLSIGSLLSHSNTREVMIVENISLSETKTAPTTISVSGRSLETFFENRIVGSNFAVSNMGVVPSYTLTAANTWTQAVKMLQDHTLRSRLVDVNNEIPGLAVDSIASGTDVAQEARIIKSGTLYERMLELLELADLGVKVVRSQNALQRETHITIHNGVDLSASLVFSWETGDLDSSEYLVTSKKTKTASYVSGNAVYTIVPGTPIGTNRRMVEVDASDIDEDYKPPHDTATWNSLQAAFGVRGRESVLINNPIEISSVDISSSARQRYRIEYNIGDIVTVDGNYGTTRKMRIIEHVEIDDENGERSYPTLSILTV